MFPVWLGPGLRRDDVNVAGRGYSLHAAVMFKRLIPDGFILILLVTIALASVLPARGFALEIAGHISNAAIFTLFFFHGLRLAHAAVWAGIQHWRLQLSILVFTFGIMPLMGLTAASIAATLLSAELWLGIFFMCALPSTVQAAIASSSMAGGNVAGSVIAAAMSNLSGVILTPLLFAALAHAGGAGVGLGTIGKVALLLLLPFTLGQVMQLWLSSWAERHRVWIGRMDRLTIVLTIFVTFSAAVNEGLWSRLSGAEMIALTGLVLTMLALAFGSAWLIGGLLGFSREDRITLLYSGAHKSLATGAPMARILFPAAQAGLIIIPLMLYHQLQLIISAWLAARFSRPT